MKCFPAVIFILILFFSHSGGIICEDWTASWNNDKQNALEFAIWIAYRNVERNKNIWILALELILKRWFGNDSAVEYKQYIGSQTLSIG